MLAGNSTALFKKHDDGFEVKADTDLTEAQGD